MTSRQSQEESPVDGPSPEGARRPRGRPKGAGRITSRVAIVTTPEYRAWLEQLLEHIGEPDLSDAIRRGMRLLAKAEGFRAPPRR